MDLSSRQTLQVINCNQGHKVGGGGPDATFSAAAVKITAMVTRAAYSEVADAALREKQIEVLQLRRKLGALEAEARARRTSY